MTGFAILPLISVLALQLSYVQVFCYKDETGYNPINVVQQQDAQEFLQVLFDRLEQSYNKICDTIHQLCINSAVNNAQFHIENCNSDQVGCDSS